MATRIRLARGGAKKRPFYRIVVSDSRAPRDGRFIEKIGTFNPFLAKDDKERVVLNAERIKYWLGEGAQPSERVASFLIAADLYKRSAKAQKVLDARIAKSQEEKKKKDAEAKAKAEAEAKAKAEEEKAAAEEAKAAEEAAAAEAPAEEPKAEESAPAEEAKAEEAPAEEAETKE